MDFVLGALVVGAIALARELFVDRKRWQRDEDAYRRVTRAARRLVADELDTARNHIELMLKKGTWPVSEFVERGNFLSTAEWERYKPRLAEGVEDENTWVVAAAFYYSLGQLRARTLTEELARALTEKERELLETMRDQAKVLHAVLSEDAALPDNWQEQLAAVREAGSLPAVDKPRPRSQPQDAD